jgi:hypothetical protein
MGELVICDADEEICGYSAYITIRQRLCRAHDELVRLCGDCDRLRGHVDRLKREKGAT